MDDAKGLQWGLAYVGYIVGVGAGVMEGCQINMPVSLKGVDI